MNEVMGIAALCKTVMENKKGFALVVERISVRCTVARTKCKIVTLQEWWYEKLPIFGSTEF